MSRKTAGCETRLLAHPAIPAQAVVQWCRDCDPARRWALPSAQQWLDLRQLRNTLAHEYADDNEQLAEGINAAFESLEHLSRIHDQIRDYVLPYLEPH